LKSVSETILEAASGPATPFITDAEVLQELVHRYRALRVWADRGAAVFRNFASLMAGRIIPMLAEDVQRAAELVDIHPRFSARDLVHLAVMERVGATAIVTADTTFDGLRDIERLDPLMAHRWLPRFISED
jgi:predicted nucleic acid-binding protein